MPIFSVLLGASATRPSPDSKSDEIMTVNGATPIIDIRPGPTEFDILQGIKRGLRPEDGREKTLPTLLLYDEAGLRLFEKITYLDEYYPTNSEIEVLEKYADRIAERIRPGSVVLELGSG
jgi:L-histidine Nalpha-methyltransferase / hercynylcysteine S-oxide synthase